MKHEKIIHLLSGGLDSVTLLHDLRHKGHDVHCLLFDYKQRHAQELLFAKQQCKKLQVQFTTLDLPALGGLTEQSWIVPNRNAIMLHTAANEAVKSGVGIVTIGCNKDDAEAFPDCRREFIEAVNHTLFTAGYSVKVEAPYILITKPQIGNIARRFHISSSDVWTCYHGGEKPCGNCPACKKLEGALCGQ